MVWVYQFFGKYYWRPISLWAYSGPHTVEEAKEICDRLNGVC